MAAFAVALQMLTGLLFANKGAILTIVYILLNSLFIARARNDRTKYRTLRRKLIGCTLLVALVAPFYLAAIGAGTGSAAAGVIGIRLISGFDQLIITSNLNLLHRDGFSPLFKTNLFEYQLMPFFKALLSTHYDHSSIGQYVIETLRGTTIEGRGTYPNSNLILETIFTSGKYFGALFFILELAAFYWGRRISLGIPITPLSLVLVQTFVLAPYGLFLSGQDWINQAVIAFVTVIVALVVSKFWNAIVKSSRSSFNRNRDSQISYATHSRPRTPSQESQIE